VIIIRRRRRRRRRIRRRKILCKNNSLPRRKVGRGSLMTLLVGHFSSLPLVKHDLVPLSHSTIRQKVTHRERPDSNCQAIGRDPELGTTTFLA
jgi:hypothetical protein